jgi:hypothetical protein
MEELLLALLRCSLWGRKFEGSITTQELNEVMVLAKRQTVTALALAPLQQGAYNEDWETISKYISRSLKIERKNTIVNHELTSFATRCKENGIDYMVVKGQVLAACYPQPKQRMPGDIDFLIRDDYATVKRRIERVFDVKLPQRMIEKEVAFHHNNMLYELHSTLLDFGSRKNNDYWNELTKEAWNHRDYTDVEGTAIATLPTTLSAVYTFCHLFHHFIREGVGLRQLCDMAMQLHACRDSIDRQELTAIIERLGMERAYRAFGCILTELLGLPAEDFPMVLSDDDRRWTDAIIGDIFRGGNFGKDHHKAKSAWRFKLETLRIVLRNTFKYYRLAPREMRMLAVMLLKINLRLMMKSEK